MKRRSFLQVGMLPVADMGAAHLTGGTSLYSALIDDLARATMSNPFPIPRQVRQTDVLVGNGGTIYGPFSFKIFDTADVEVWMKAAASTTFVKIAASVAKSTGEPLDTFTVTTAVQIGDADQFVVRSIRLAERSASVVSGARVDITALDKELSKIASMHQEHRRDIDRALKVEFGGVGMTIDSAITNGGVLMRSGQRLVEGPNLRAIAAEVEQIRDLVSGWASDIVSQGNVPIYATAAGMPSLAVPPGLNFLRVNGYAASGDRGAANYRLAANDTEYANTATRLRFTSQNGQKFVVAEPVLNQYMAGAAGGGANDTLAFQAIISASVGRSVAFLPGIHVCENLQGVDDIRIAAHEGCVLKRPNNAATSNEILKFVGKKRFSITGALGLDGNAANNAVVANNLLVQNCGAFSIEGLNCDQATGCGAVIQVTTDAADATASRVANSSFKASEMHGLLLLDAANCDIESNDCIANLFDGIYVDSTSDIAGLRIHRNTVLQNRSGIVLSGHKNNDPNQTNLSLISVVGNDVRSNSHWGVAAQCDAATISANVISRNGSNNNHSGLLMNGVELVATGNVISGNFYFGVDAGDAEKFIIEGNYIAYNGNAGVGIGINAESVAGGSISDNRLVDNLSVQIYVRGIGGSGEGVPFVGKSNSVSVAGNNMQVSNSSRKGLLVDGDCDFVDVGVNYYYGFEDPFDAAKFGVTNGSIAAQRGPNVHRVTLTAADLVTIPDHGDFFYVVGTTSISTILTQSQADYNGKVRRVDQTNKGSGYTSAPAVTISGGGGAGATAEARIARRKVEAIYISNWGSGYTSSPTVSITGGGGLGATAIASIDCNNQDAREITLAFGGVLTLNNGAGNLNLTATHTTQVGSVLKLVGSFGNWVQLSYNQ